MTPQIARWVPALLSPLLVCACSTMTTGKRPETPDGDKCLQLYTQVDARIAAAGVGDASYHRIEGFPYLRSDRFSASFANEIPDTAAFWEWVGYLRANEDESREIELHNLKMPNEEAASLLLDMRACGGWLRSWELEDEPFRAKLKAASAVPDDYSTGQRVAGLYALAVPFLKRGIAEEREALKAGFAAPLETPQAPSELMTWKVMANPENEYEPGTIDLRNKPRDLLGRVGLLWSEVVHLAYTHAPTLLIETVGDYDRLGAPVHSANGPDVDIAMPVVYYLPGLTRFGGRSLLQISYFYWFPERLARSKGDGGGGAMDGLIWRVTFDEQGRPLMHDSIRASGADHLDFPVQSALQRREDAIESVMFPQTDVPSGSIAVRLRTGTHDVMRVIPASAAGTGRQATYALKTYDELLNLPDPKGGTRSLFDPDGFIVGTERSERFWVWPSGLRNAGALRQWSHHATTSVGRAHFDDPFLMEQLFVAPKRPAPPPPVVEAKRPAVEADPGGPRPP